MINRKLYIEPAPKPKSYYEQLATDEEIRSLLNESELEKEFLINRSKSRQGSRAENSKIKVIDWKETDFYRNCVSGKLKPYNHSHDPKFFTETEIDYVIDMIQTRFNNFIKGNYCIWIRFEFASYRKLRQFN